MNLKYISLFVVWLLALFVFINPRLCRFWMSFPALLKGMCYL